MIFMCRLVAVFMFLLFFYSGLKELEIYFNEGAYAGLSLARIWESLAENGPHTLRVWASQFSPGLRLFFEDALEQTAWVIFLPLSLLLFVICKQRKRSEGDSHLDEWD